MYTEINLLPSSIYLTASTVQLHTPHAHLCFGCWKPGPCVDALSGNLPLLPTFLSPVVLAVTRAVPVLDTKVAHSGKAFSSVHPFPEAGQVWDGLGFLFLCMNFLMACFSGQKCMVQSSTAAEGVNCWVHVLQMLCSLTRTMEIKCSCSPRLGLVKSHWVSRRGVKTWAFVLPGWLSRCLCRSAMALSPSAFESMWQQFHSKLYLEGGAGQGPTEFVVSPPVLLTIPSLCWAIRSPSVCGEQSPCVGAWCSQRKKHIPVDLNTPLSWKEQTQCHNG